jgi:transketolase
MNDIKIIARTIRKTIIEMAYCSKTGHIGSALSCVDILISIFYNIIDLKKDKFILSKGHATSAYYAILHELDIITSQELKTYCADNSLFWGHPNHKIKGIEFSSGALGHGLGIASGLACAAQLKKQNNFTYVLLSDGECNEGTVWESAALISTKQLPVIAIVDNNNIQATNYYNILSKTNLADLWKASGWNTFEIDGHNINQISETIQNNKEHYPLAVIAKTIKGKGIKEMENDIEWHYKRINDDSYHSFLKELER